MERREIWAARRAPLVAVAVAVLLAACAVAKPFEYHPTDEIPEGPGLVTGEDGEWVIYAD